MSFDLVEGDSPGGTLGELASACDVNGALARRCQSLHAVHGVNRERGPAHADGRTHLRQERPWVESIVGDDARTLLDLRFREPRPDEPTE